MSVLRMSQPTLEKQKICDLSVPWSNNQTNPMQIQFLKAFQGI